MAVNNEVPPPTKPINKAHYTFWLMWLGIAIATIVLINLGIQILTPKKGNSLPSPTLNTNNSDGQTEQPLTEGIAPLTGQTVPIDITVRRPWATVIENFPTVRPQAGLSAADIIFEAPTEGGITRFLAIFQSKLPPASIGPIRSARPYFNDWASTFHAFYSHSGGTSEALQQLKNGYGSLQDVNEFYNGDAYERLLDRKPPHNLFTNAERFWNYLISQGWERTSSVPSLTFTNNLPATSAANSITVPYYPPEYRVRYDWRDQDKVYLRAVDGNTQLDASTNSPLQIKNVMVMFTDIVPIPRDPLLKVNLTTLGGGKVLLFNNGQKYEGKWLKPNLESPLSFVDEQGNSLPLTPGNIWISVVDNSLADSIKIEQ